MSRLALRKISRVSTTYRQSLRKRQTEDDEFFTEWFEDLPELSDTEKVALSSIRQRYVYHRNDGPLLEGTVNLVVVSPLLTVAGFLDPPFKIRSPESVKISIDDPDEIIKGLIDVLVVQEQLWIVVVGSKRNTIPVTAALPQILAYMMAGLSGNEPIFGLVRGKGSEDTVGEFGKRLGKVG